MEFKSRIDLALFFAQLEKDGWVEPEWLLKPYNYVRNNEEFKGTRATKVFKINFNNINRGQRNESR
jgi:hypothetical protein